MIRILDEFLWTLRRAGIPISTTQAIDAAKALALVGVSDRSTVFDALRAVLVHRSADRSRYRTAFDAFFAAERQHPGSLASRLRARGLTETEVRVLLTLIDTCEVGATGTPMVSLLDLGVELDAALQRAPSLRAALLANAPRPVGFHATAILGELGVEKASRSQRAMQETLRANFGEERGDALGEVLRDEIHRLRSRVRDHVAEKLTARAPQPNLQTRIDKPFRELTPAERVEVEQGVRTFALRLRGAVRARRARRGPLDAGRTLRRNLAHGGAPVYPVFRKRRHRPARLVIACDVSPSMRHASALLLEIVRGLGNLLPGTRSFVFVSEVAETTSPLGPGADNDVVGRGADSNYGRAFASLDKRVGAEIGPRTVLIILGDGRNNFLPDDGLAQLRSLARRAQAVFWLCPEPPSLWGTGDSRMQAYGREVTQVVAVETARDLERAMRELLFRSTPAPRRFGARGVMEGRNVAEGYGMLPTRC